MSPEERKDRISALENENKLLRERSHKHASEIQTALSKAEAALAMNEQGRKDREMIQQIKSDLSRHEAVCAEAEKQRTAFRGDMKGWIARMQATYEQGQSDLSERHSRAINQLADSIRTTFQKLSEQGDRMSNTITQHSEQDIERFTSISSQISKSQSFISGGWRTLMLVGAVFYAVVQTVISIAALYHH